MAIAPPTTSDGAIAGSAATVAFMAFLTLFLIALASVAGGLTVEGILGGVAIPNKSMVCAIIAVILLVAAGVFSFLAAVFA